MTHLEACWKCGGLLVAPDSKFRTGHQFKGTMWPHMSMSSDVGGRGGGAVGALDVKGVQIARLEQGRRPCRRGGGGG